MFEIIFIVILLTSFIGMLIMLYLKVSVLAELVEGSKEKGTGLFAKLKNHKYIESLTPKKVLSRILSSSQSLASRVENKTSSLLDNLHEKPQTRFSEDYWKKVRRKRK